MIIESLRAKNFMRFGEFELAGMPDSGLVGIFGDNECGKSTMGQMLSYALFGRTPRAPEGEPSTLVKWGAEEMSVDLTFMLGDNRFRIVRELGRDGKAKAKLTNLTINEVVAENGENLEKEIDYLLGYGFREFRYSTFIGQNELDLILHSTDDRKLVLNNMLGVGFMDRIARKVADKRKYHETEFRVHQRRITDKEEVLEVYLSRKKDLERIDSRRDTCHKELVEAIRERERTASTMTLLEDIRRKREKFNILDMRIKDRREHLRAIEMEISELMRDADSMPKLKLENRDKDALIQELKNTRLADVSEKLERVEKYKELQKKVSENEQFIARKEEAMREFAAKLEEIESKERECRELEKKREELDYLLESFLEEGRFRSTTSHLMKDIELVDAELDKVRTSLQKDFEMVQEREASARGQIKRLERQRNAVTTDEVNQEELIRLQGDIEVATRRRDIGYILDGVFFVGSLIPTLVFSETIYLAGMALLAPFSIFALLAQAKVKSCQQKMTLAQQQLYAFNISQRGIQEIDESEEEMADELNAIVERREGINDRLTAMSYFACDDFERIEKAIDEMRKMNDPLLARAREMMETMLDAYDKLRKALPEKLKFSEVKNLDVAGFISDKKAGLVELDRKIAELKAFSGLKGQTISHIESLNSEVRTSRDVMKAYAAERDGLGVTDRDEGPLEVEKKEIALQCEQLRREIEENRRRLAMIEAQAERVKELETRRRDIVKEIDADLINYYEMREATRDIDCSDEKFSLLYERKEYLDRKVSDLTASLQNVDKEKKLIEKDMNRAASVRKEIAALQKEARSAEEYIIKYRELETLFIKTGLDIKKRLVPQVESYFGWILPRMTRGRYQKVRLSDEFEVRVFSYEKNDYVNLDVLSGGTVDQLLISLRLAFARAATTNALHPNRFLFLDEPFSSFDQSRRELFFNLLQTLKPNFRQIFLISHLPNLEEFVDHYVHVDLTGEKQPVIYSWK